MEHRLNPEQSEITRKLNDARIFGRLQNYGLCVQPLVFGERDFYKCFRVGNFTEVTVKVCLGKDRVFIEFGEIMNLNFGEWLEVLGMKEAAFRAPIHGFEVANFEPTVSGNLSFDDYILLLEKKILLIYALSGGGMTIIQAENIKSTDFTVKLKLRFANGKEKKFIAIIKSKDRYNFIDVRHRIARKNYAAEESKQTLDEFLAFIDFPRSRLGGCIFRDLDRRLDLLLNP